jgi:hypothetical protein
MSCRWSAERGAAIPAASWSTGRLGRGAVDMKDMVAMELT